MGPGYSRAVRLTDEACPQPGSTSEQGRCRSSLQPVLGGVVKVQLVPEHFSWITSEHVIAAVAVIAVAVAAAALWNERQAQLATFRPLVVDVPAVAGGEVVTWEDHAATGGDIRITIPVRNVGNGPALLYGSWFSPPGGQAAGMVDREVIAVSETAHVYIVAAAGTSMVRPLQEAVAQNGTYRATVSYYDLSRRRFQTIFHFVTSAVNPHVATVERLVITKAKQKRNKLGSVSPGGCPRVSR